MFAKKLGPPINASRVPDIIINVSNSPWKSSCTNGTPDWLIDNNGYGVNPNLPNSNNIVYLTYNGGITRTYNPSHTYQVITNVNNFYTNGLSFSVKTPHHGEKFWYDNTKGTLPPSPGNGNLYFYTSPKSIITTENHTTYAANRNFGLTPSGGQNEKILSVAINELKNWKIQGFAWYKIPPLSLTPNSSDSLGWVYSTSSNSFIWYDSNSNTRYPAGGNYGFKSANAGYRKNNYIAKFVQYQFFNISFYYQTNGGNPNDIVSIYLSPTLPSSSPGNVQLPGTLIATMSNIGISGTHSSFYGLKGGQYIYFVADSSNSSSYTVALSNFKIEGGYHSGNNQQWLMTNGGAYSGQTILSPIGLTGATYTAYSGYGNTINATSSLTVYKINSYVGNGKFKAGIWENGVWNSGWRYDDSVREFFDVGLYYEYNRSKQWRFTLNGPESSVNEFKIGDKISIGNIVAIDINENRKLIKNYFTIIGKLPKSIIIEFTNDFPLRRIEKDSPYHRIYVSKNIWLSGAFLNGYFRGIWNYGLFKGYPKITEMYDTQWIDGIFDGGHYKVSQYSLTFSNTIYTQFSGVPGEPPKLGLTFSNKHNLTVGDLIEIYKDDISINPEYNGQAKVIDVPNEYQIVVDKDWGVNTNQNETGIVFTNLSSGVIQNFEFNSRNISKVTSVESMESDSVFIYNSWIDVIFTKDSAVNIGKPQSQLDKTLQLYSENNLYGYPTFDVLSSVSKFRDSFSLEERTYKLGTKYKIYNDYIGDSSKFEDPLGLTSQSTYLWPAIIIDDELFNSQGWSYSRAIDIGGTSLIESLGAITFSRTLDSGTYPIVGDELKVEAQGAGGVLNFIDVPGGIPLRTKGSIEKQRYSMIEFDLITYSVAQTSIGNNYGNLITNTTSTGYTYEPIIHFNNINKVKRDVYYPNIGSGVTLSTTLDATYLPIWENIDHLSTSITKKIEYFYNKRKLSMYFRGSGNYGQNRTVVVLDNIKFYEIDMVPFFKYFEENNINFSIQVPYQGIAPFIDYTNSNFSFIDNISIGFGSVQIQQTFLPFSGVGVAIGSLKPINLPYMNMQENFYIKI
jgi:hypothetical protein